MIIKTRKITSVTSRLTYCRQAWCHT